MGAPIAVTPPPPPTETEVSSVPATPSGHQPPSRQVHTIDFIRTLRHPVVANGQSQGQSFDDRDSMDDVEATASGEGNAHPAAGNAHPALQSDDYAEDQEMAQVQA